LKILIVEPYFTGSHAAWAEGYRKNSDHSVEILSLPGRFWKWRMHGGAVTLARRFVERGQRPDLVLATDMLDLTTFLSLTRPLSDGLPVAMYFHENQITYPWPAQDRDRLKGRDGHYGFINFSSALAATAVFFNSSFHRRSFLDGLGRYLRAFPDFNCLSSLEEIERKSSVLYVGMDFRVLDEAMASTGGAAPEGPPLILWNHRWEEDKNPGEFFRALYVLMERGVDFEVAVLGENFKKAPNVFNEARARLGKRVVHFGYVDDLRAYAGWLMRADILPVTSEHDFFGCSVVEAMYCGVYPILPRRLAYPEHFVREYRVTPGEAAGVMEPFFYDGFDELVSSLERAVRDIDKTRRISRTLKARVARYGWDKMATLYDREFEGIGRAVKEGA